MIKAKVVGLGFEIISKLNRYFLVTVKKDRRDGQKSALDGAFISIHTGANRFFILSMAVSTLF